MPIGSESPLSGSRTHRSAVDQTRIGCKDWGSGRFAPQNKPCQNAEEPMMLHPTSNGATQNLLGDLGETSKRVRRAVEALRGGEAILIGDDGARENEVDYVFPAKTASIEQVNFALTHCKGLLCVSVSPERADALGFATAPRTAGLMAHTGFTVSVDARHNISSGISAGDRAITIQLMGSVGATPQDFVTPGHVFPVRAEHTGLLTRTGHTEAVLELCRLAGISEAAAMCEVLGPDGSALPVRCFEQPDSDPFAIYEHLPFVSTVDLLWYRLLQDRPTDQPKAGIAVKLDTHWQLQTHAAEAESCSALLHNSTLDPFILPCSFEGQARPMAGGGQARVPTSVHPRRLTWNLIGGLESVQGGAPAEDSDLIVNIFAPGQLRTPLPDRIDQFCDLSAKDGIEKIAPAARRCLTALLAAEALAEQFSDPSAASRQDWVQEAVASFPLEDDRVFLLNVLHKRSS